MVLLIIAAIYILDAIARTYINEDGVSYELPNGELKQVIKRK